MYTDLSVDCNKLGQDKLGRMILCTCICIARWGGGVVELEDPHACARAVGCLRLSWEMDRHHHERAHPRDHAFRPRFVRSRWRQEDVRGQA